MMSLDKDILKLHIKEALEKAKDAPPPEDSDDIEEHKNDVLEQMAIDLAEAIHNYIKKGDVVSYDPVGEVILTPEEERGNMKVR